MRKPSEQRSAAPFLLSNAHPFYCSCALRTIPLYTLRKSLFLAPLRTFASLPTPSFGRLKQVRLTSPFIENLGLLYRMRILTIYPKLINLGGKPLLLSLTTSLAISSWVRTILSWTRSVSFKINLEITRAKVNIAFRFFFLQKRVKLRTDLSELDRNQVIQPGHP